MRRPVVTYLALKERTATPITDAMKNVLTMRDDTNPMPVEMVYATVAVTVLKSRWRARTNTQT
jgi:hypothetical protein